MKKLYPRIPLPVVFKPEDFVKAIPKDGEHCVLAEALRRTFGYDKVDIKRTRVVIVKPDRRGVLHEEVYGISAQDSKRIARFDASNGAEWDDLASAEIVLHPVRRPKKKGKSENKGTSPVVLARPRTSESIQKQVRSRKQHTLEGGRGV